MKLAQALGLGASIAMSLLVGIVIGLKLDEHFGTKPLWTIVGILFGIISSLSLLYRLAKNDD